MKINDQHFYLSLTKICFIAVVLRAAWALLIPVIPLSDSAAYDIFAQNIWMHGTYGWKADEPTSFWPVGTSAIYSLFYFMFGHTYTPIVIFNIACSVGLIIFSKKLSDRFFDNPSVSYYVAIIIACWPTLIFYTTVLASELPYLLFISAGLYYFTGLNNDLKKGGLLAGLLFAISYYIRPLAIITLGIGVFYLLITYKQKNTVIFKSIICFTLLALFVSPWAYRNYQLYGAFVSMSTNGGATLWMGNKPGTNGGFLPLPEYVKGLDEHTRNQTLKQEAINYIKDDPLLFITRTAKKFISFHTRETIGVSWNQDGIKSALGESAIKPLKVVTQLYWSALLILSIAGLLLYLRNNGLWKTLFHLWASTAAIHALIVSQDRYHIPLAPVIAAFAAYFICFIRQKMHGNNPSKAGI